MNYPILAKAEVMLDRIEAAVKAKLGSAQSPDADMDASTHVMCEQKVNTLSAKYQEARVAFMETITQQQQHLYDTYRNLRHSNLSARSPDDPVYDRTAELNAKKEFIRSLDKPQKTLHKQLKGAKAALEQARLDEAIATGRSMRWGIKPSDQMKIADVAFPESNTYAQNMAIAEVLNALSYIVLVSQGVKIETWKYPKLTFQYIYNQQKRLIGLTVTGTKLEKKEVPAILNIFKHTLTDLRDHMMPEFNRHWEKVRTSRGIGYRYASNKDYGNADPVYMIANSLAVYNKELNSDDRALFFKKGDGTFVTHEGYKALPTNEKCKCTFAIVLTGETAKRVLVDEFGLNLAAIREAPNARGRVN